MQRKGGSRIIERETHPALGLIRSQTTHGWPLNGTDGKIFRLPTRIKNAPYAVKTFWHCWKIIQDVDRTMFRLVLFTELQIQKNSREPHFSRAGVRISGRAYKLLWRDNDTRCMPLNDRWRDRPSKRMSRHACMSTFQTFDKNIHMCCNNMYDVSRSYWYTITFYTDVWFQFLLFIIDGERQVVLSYDCWRLTIGPPL